MPPRRRKKPVAINTKQLIDIIAASLIVQKAPALISSFADLDPNVSKIAGVGAGYLVGVMMKRPDIANASIALGVVDFVSPMVDGLIGGGSEITQVVNGGKGSGALGPPLYQMTKPNVNVADYLNLNDYVSDPDSRMSSAMYRDSY